MDVSVVIKRSFEVIKLVARLHHGSLKVVELLMGLHCRDLEW